VTPSTNASLPSSSHQLVPPSPSFTMTANPTMSTTATLSNLYIPLPIISSPIQYNPHSRIDSSTNESRSKRSLRSIHLSKSPLSQSTGSSLVELGNTKLLVSVRGPRSVGGCSFGKDGGLVCEGELRDPIS
jgi:hypothetical protein